MVEARIISLKKRKKLTPEEKKKAEALLKKKQEEDSQMVTGVFKNLEGEGEISFNYGIYPDEPSKVYCFQHNEECTIPLGVAKHINNVAVKQRDYILDAQGVPTLKTGVKGTRQRMQFISKNFM